MLPRLMQPSLSLLLSEEEAGIEGEEESGLVEVVAAEEEELEPLLALISSQALGQTFSALPS